MSDFLYLDIETLPSADASLREQFSSDITPPGNISKPETITAWLEEKKPGLIDEAMAKTSLDGAYGSICCIGWAWNNDEPTTMVMGNEDMLLMSAVRAIHATNPETTTGRPKIVGHNIGGFDIRFLWQRAFVHGVVMPWWFPRNPKPWDENIHDTMTMWSGRDYAKLSKLCWALGVPDDDEFDGSDVARLWADNRREDIAIHCGKDIVKVREVHRKILTAYGEWAGE